MRKIILASGSPRRKALLKQIGLKFDVEVSHFEEKINKIIEPHNIAKRLSLGKAKTVAIKHKNAIIIAADTFVVLNGKIIGKPKTAEEAKKILSSLSGKSHTIITGLTLIDTKMNKVVSKSVETKVYLKKMTPQEIEAYVTTGEPLDKAGGYGIQKLGGIFIEKIEGDYFNVVGLPIFTLREELKKLGVRVL